MKKLMLLVVVCFASTLLLSIETGKSYANGVTSWTGNIAFSVKHTDTEVKGKTQVLEVTTLHFTGTATLTTDLNGDPVLSGGTPSCYIKITGTQAPAVATTICINSLAIVSIDKKTGETAMIVGTGTVTEGANNGIIFLQANWSQRGISPIKSIKLSKMEMQGGAGVLTDSGGYLIGITVPRSVLLEVAP